MRGAFWNPSTRPRERLSGTAHRDTHETPTDAAALSQSAKQRQSDEWLASSAREAPASVRRLGRIISALPEIIDEEIRLHRVEVLLLPAINEMSFLCDDLIKEYIEGFQVACRECIGSNREASRTSGADPWFPCANGIGS